MTCKLSLLRMSSQKGKDCLEEVEKKGLWWDWSMRVADGWPETSDFLSRKLLRLPEFGFLVSKTPQTLRIDALWQTQSSILFWMCAKLQKVKLTEALEFIKLLELWGLVHFKAKFQLMIIASASLLMFSCVFSVVQIDRRRQSQIFSFRWNKSWDLSDT